jgi:uncharacterized coiled-coil protein SlyX
VASLGHGRRAIDELPNPTLKTGTQEMDELTFQRKMQELMARIKAMPETATAEASASVDQAGERRERIKASVAELQESLDYLRLSVKYLVFDLEATRRENAYLRRMLEQSSRDAQRDLRDQDDDGDERFD